VQIALAAQRALGGGGVDKLLKEAENEIRQHNLPQAIAKYQQAIRIDSNNPTLQLEVGLLYKDKGDWVKAAEAFLQATRLSPIYSAAQRELGIAQNKLYQRADESAELPTGEKALRAAIALDDQDFDAYASMGGILKRLQRHGEALTMYQQATKVSQGHPYPLLNEIKLQVWQEGMVQLSPKQLSQLNRAERMVRAQTQDYPPFNAPWCFFDLSDINFFLNSADACIQALNEGIFHCTSAWQAQTHLASMRLMTEALEENDTFRQSISLLEEEIPHLPGFDEQ
jgi:tetratricopeptide (TPR) repeat protein